MFLKERAHQNVVVLTRIGVLLAVGIILPVIFHGLGIPGKCFCPCIFRRFLLDFSFSIREALSWWG